MTDERIDPEGLREWTLMFYLASDNPLAPSIVSQLKALKAAGFHAGVNVVAHFDPYTRDTPSHIFEVNAVEKRKLPPDESFVGFDARDPFVRNLVLDKLWEEDDDAGDKVGKRIEEMLKKRRNAVKDDSRKLRVLPKADFNRKSERSPKESLGAFLKLCREKYPAKRYMLFILGHGVVVGNDVFLFDSEVGDDEGDAHHTASGNGNSGNSGGRGAKDDKPRRRNSLTLAELAGLLGDFKAGIGESKFELVSFHSCSMSGVEVAYQLQNMAHYMLASQGPAFVGSWPYRHILLKIFNELDSARKRGSELSDADIKEMLRDIFYYVVYNSYDFQLAGYSFDLALCDLTKATSLKAPVAYLAQALKAGLAGGDDLADDDEVVPLARELMLLSHWDAQSFWQENYTDLYDFCLRLRRRCKHVFPHLKEPSDKRANILDACEAVMQLLEKGVEGDDDRLIVRAEFVGPEYQYSHGFSIFFPWSQPADRFFDETYVKYEFAKDTGWALFLDEYFEKTRRETREQEDKSREKENRSREAAVVEVGATGPAGRVARRGEVGEANGIEREALELLQVIGTRVFTTDGQLAKNGVDDRTGPGPNPAKSGPDDPTGGGDCGCPTFKNHPSFTGVGRNPKSKSKGTQEEQPMGQTIGGRFTLGE
jgi:hypothetical protein